MTSVATNTTQAVTSTAAVPASTMELHRRGRAGRTRSANASRPRAPTVANAVMWCETVTTATEATPTTAYGRDPVARRRHRPGAQLARTGNGSAAVWSRY